MIRNRGAFATGPSKASPQTLCQKCLKKDNYECKATTQERPYASRPSRTQQLANPKLIPRLSSDVPNELLRKSGIADEQLAKTEQERSRKRAADENDPPDGIRKRHRSVSSSSSTSVSTISTNLSRSASPKRSKLSNARSLRESGSLKRRRSLSSSEATYSSDSSYQRRRKSQADEEDRNTRRRRSSISPGFRGRDVDHGRQRKLPRSRSDSMDKDDIARHRNSRTPDRRTNHDRNNGHAYERPRFSDDNDRYGASHRDRGRGERDDPPRKQQPAPPTRKERSLSPFSKRLALTQAMNMGR